MNQVGEKAMHQILFVLCVKFAQAGAIIANYLYPQMKVELKRTERWCCDDRYYRNQARGITTFNPAAI